MRVTSPLIAGAVAISLSLGLSPAPAQARGCIKGAIIGGIAGHFAGRHGMVGAGAGCVIGRSRANNLERERARREDDAQYRQYNNGRSFEDDHPDYGYR